MDNGRNGVTLKSSHPIRWGRADSPAVASTHDEPDEPTDEPTPERSNSDTVVLRKATIRNPSVSIVIPAYNVEEYIVETLASVLGQKLRGRGLKRLTRKRDFEVIIVDDGSTDRTLQLCSALCDDHTTLVTKSNGGTGSALNVGFSHARGKYLTWWSADSVMLPGFLKSLSETLDKDRRVGFVYSDWAILAESGDVVAQKSPNEDVVAKTLVKRCDIGVCWMWRREVLDKCGPYSLELCEDYDMHLRMARATKFRHVPKVLGHWRDRPDNLTSTKCIPAKWVHSYRAQARDKWNDSATLKIAYVAPNIDSAGVGWWHCRAFVESERPVAIRHIVGNQTYLNQLVDIELWTGTEEAHRVLDECDVVHWNSCLPGTDDFQVLDLDRIKGKPFIVHLHGGQYYWDRDKMREAQDELGATILSCSPHIAELIPGARWMPNVIPLGDGRTHSELFEPGPGWPKVKSPPTICMHHNYPAGKGCDQVSWILERLTLEYGVQMSHSVSNKNHAQIHEHIEQKKTFDLVIDQITQGFVGIAAWESLAQGAVVFGRIDEWAESAYLKLGGGVLPPIQQCRWADELAMKLMDFLKYPQQIVAAKRASRAWMLEHYATEKLLGMWEAVYHEVLQ